MIIQNQEPASPVAAIQEELVLDTADFDIFSSLDDLKVESKVVKTQPENVIEDDVAQDEATEDADEFEEEGFDFSDLDDDDVNDYSENDGYEKDEVEEEELDEEVEYEDEEGEEVEADDGFEEEEVEYDGYMVNLPDGSEVNLADAVQGYRNAEAVREMQEHFTSQKEAFVEEAKNLMSHMELAKLEADRVIDDYDNFDWVKLSQEDPQKYVDNREFLDKYKVRRSEIQSAMNDINETKQANEEAAFTATAQACVTELKADIPGWNDDLYGDLMSYAVDNGASEDEMSRCVDPSIFKMLHKARQFDSGKQVVKAKVRKAVRSPKKVVRSQPKSNKAPTSLKATLIKKMDAGEMDGDVFAHLED